MSFWFWIYAAFSAGVSVGFALAMIRNSKLPDKDDGEYS